MKKWLRNLFFKPTISPAYIRAQGLLQPFHDSGIWGCGWLPSPLFNIRQARGLIEHYGLVIKYEGGLEESGPWMNWYVWYPEERWAGKPKWIPSAHGQGPTLGEAVVRCLLDCENQGILGKEKGGPIKLEEIRQ